MWDVVFEKEYGLDFTSLALNLNHHLLFLKLFVYLCTYNPCGLVRADETTDKGRYIEAIRPPFFSADFGDGGGTWVGVLCDWRMGA